MRMAEKKKATPEQMQKIAEWQKANVRQYIVRLNRNTEADLIDKLESEPSVQGYIKELIREDISK